MSAYREPARPILDGSRAAAELRNFEASLRRSQRQRERVVSALRWLGAALFIVAVGWAVYAYGMWEYRRQSRCEDRGGVWLSREGKCVRGVER